jgi:hypothetical protein
MYFCFLLQILIKLNSFKLHTSSPQNDTLSADTRAIFLTKIWLKMTLDKRLSCMDWHFVTVLHSEWIQVWHLLILCFTKWCSLIFHFSQLFWKPISIRVWIDYKVFECFFSDSSVPFSLPCMGVFFEASYKLHLVVKWAFVSAICMVLY